MTGAGEPAVSDAPPGLPGRALDALVSVFNAGGSVWIFGIMMLLCADVLGRAAFNAPIDGVPLLVALSIVVIVFLQLPAAIRAGRLTRSDALLSRLLDRQPSIGVSLRSFYDGLGVLVMGAVVFYTLPTLVKVWERGTYEGLEGDFALPSWPFKVLILVGATLCGIEFLRALGGGGRELAAQARAGKLDVRRVAMLAAAVVFAAAALGVVVLGAGLSKPAIGIVSILFVVVFVYVGVHVGVALSLISFFCVWGVRGDVGTAGKLLALSIGESMQAYEFGVIPLFVLMGLLVLGGIYGGLFTATEAGGVGALGALVLTFFKRALTPANLWRALSETGHVTASICFLLVSAHIYSRMIALTGIPNIMEGYVEASGLGLAGLLAIYIFAIILMGTILDAGSIMLITVPLAIPALAPFGVDLVWFGIVTIIAVEIGLLTPPLGLACFVIHNNLADDRIRIDDVFWGAAPFALTMLVVLLMVVAFPELATALV